jgi:hypothetical protein
MESLGQRRLHGPSETGERMRQRHWRHNDYPQAQHHHYHHPRKRNPNASADAARHGEFSVYELYARYTLTSSTGRKLQQVPLHQPGCIMQPGDQLSKDHPRRFRQMEPHREGRLLRHVGRCQCLRWRDRRRFVADTYDERRQRYSNTAAHAAWHDFELQEVSLCGAGRCLQPAY